MGKNMIYTYCIKDENGANKPALIGSEEYQKWRNNYKRSFTDGTYAGGGDAKLDVRDYYCDPDTTYTSKCDNRFFEQLQTYLKKMEVKLADKLQGRFEYEFIQSEGIKVTGTDGQGREIEPYFLRSDQLGFSAPSSLKAHPYDLYLMENDYSDKALDNVITWVCESRTIGGSFVWPRPFYDGYNPARGGRITSNRRYYIQDRVDLTLWEIRYWYEKSDRNTIMRNTAVDGSNLDIWLAHFNDFDTYVEFFHFQEFVDGKSGKALPIDILSGKTDEADWGINGENPTIKIMKGMNPGKLEAMLSRVNEMIMDRTMFIEGGCV